MLEQQNPALRSEYRSTDRTVLALEHNDASVVLQAILRRRDEVTAGHSTLWCQSTAATRAREPRRPRLFPCQPAVSRRTWKGAMQVVRLWHNTRPSRAVGTSLATPLLLRQSLGRQTLTPSTTRAPTQTNNKNHIYIRLRRGGARSREEQEDQGGAPCLNDVGLLGGVGANTSAIFGDRSESAEERDAQTMASVGIEGCVGFSLTVSTNPCNTSRSSLPALASPTGEGGRSEADLSNKQRSSKDLEVIRGRNVEGFDRPTVWARSRPFPLL